jgi:energy-coupling factor transporter ATP-binding protein EcfA2/Pyruvate/2-oxoacid:ferredoxin oxidoreductase delta subunit
VMRAQRTGRQAGRQAGVGWMNGSTHGGLVGHPHTHTHAHAHAHSQSQSVAHRHTGRQAGPHGRQRQDGWTGRSNKHRRSSLSKNDTQSHTHTHTHTLTCTHAVVVRWLQAKTVCGQARRLALSAGGSTLAIADSDVVLDLFTRHHHRIHINNLDQTSPPQPPLHLHPSATCAALDTRVAASCWTSGCAHARHCAKPLFPFGTVPRAHRRRLCTHTLTHTHTHTPILKQPPPDAVPPTMHHLDCATNLQSHTHTHTHTHTACSDTPTRSVSESADHPPSSTAMSLRAAAAEEKSSLTRIAIVNDDRCLPKKCRQECKRTCPVVRMGKLCIEVSPTDKIAFISEELCIGCGICVKVCSLFARRLVHVALMQWLARNAPLKRSPSSTCPPTWTAIPSIGTVPTRSSSTGASACSRIADFRGPIRALMRANLALLLLGARRHGHGLVSCSLPTPRPGQVLGLVGTNGIGKSTALKILAGKLKPNLGRFKVRSAIPLSRPRRSLLPVPLTPNRILRTGRKSSNTFVEVSCRTFSPRRSRTISRPSSSPSMWTKSPRLPALLDRSSRFWTRKTTRIVWPTWRRPWVRCFATVLLLIAQRAHPTPADLTNFLSRNVEELSGGELQRFAIAMTCVQRGDVYMFDEPSSYLDVKQRLKCARVIRSLAKPGVYVIVVEHDLSVLDYLSDFICCLYGMPGIYGVVTMPFSVREGALSSWLVCVCLAAHAAFGSL